MSTPEFFKTSSAKATFELGRALASRFDVGDCVALVGDLGAGKTVLTRGLAVGLGLADDRFVASPTYVLVHEYPGRCSIYHLDLYRMGEPDMELRDLGLDEMLETGVVLIEWANRAERALPHPHWQIDIDIRSPRRREITLRQVIDSE
jgi:tRNA threonylcarbamoyl adenosine modification protein YjeE